MAKKRGRPPGRTQQGEETRTRLYETALRLFSERGYEETTLRAIAREADVSPALLYRYFPNKPAVVTLMYDQLTEELAVQAAAQPQGTWANRFETTLHLSLGVIRPHRELLRAVMPAMMIDRDVGLFSPLGLPGRLRVRQCFLDAIRDATDAPAQPLAAILGRLLDQAHLMIILFWLLDRSAEQRATKGLLDMIHGMKPAAPAALWLPGLTSTLATLDGLLTDAFYPRT